MTIKQIAIVGDPDRMTDRSREELQQILAGIGDDEIEVIWLSHAAFEEMEQIPSLVLENERLANPRMFEMPELVVKQGKGQRKAGKRDPRSYWGRR